MTRHRTCDACRHWQPLDDMGACRRHPPTIHGSLVQLITDEMGATEETILEAAGKCTLFPMTRSDDWCGEFNWPEDDDDD